MKKLLGSLICRFRGHLRGKLVTDENLDEQGRVVRTFRCPRCARKTMYRQKPIVSLPNPIRISK